MHKLTKKQSREEFTKRRNNLSDNYIQEFSMIVCHRLLDYFTFQDKAVSLFLPITHKKEINTFYLLEEILVSNTVIGIPKVNFETLELVHYIFESDKQLKLSVFSIPEPTYGTILPVECLDYVIVPLLAFDKVGNRVGYGKGFYDRLLKRCPLSCRFIGISLFEPIDEIIDADHNDIRLHYCITPYAKYDF